MDFIWTQISGELNVSWERKGDRWMSSILRAGAESGVDVGIRHDMNSGPFHEFMMSRDGREISTLLLVAALENGNLIYGYGSRVQEIDHSVIRQWEGLVATATDESARQLPMRKWTAVLGQPPEGNMEISVKLKSPGAVSQMRLRPSGTYIYELSALQAPSFYSKGCTASFPVLVRGASPGYDWNDAHVQAARELSRLCHLLSVEWKSLIVIREQPAPLEWGERKHPTMDVWVKEEHLPRMEDPQSREVEIEDWFSRAFVRIGKNKKIADALSVFAEGASIQFFHPSLALVSYISAIETISGTMFRSDVACSECGSKYRGIAAKFRETLKIVVDGEKLKLLCDAYQTRSLTVHSGRLHGSELSHGVHQLRLLTPQPDQDFQWKVVHAMRGAARDLLALAVRDELPRKLELPN